ncbi:MAG: ComF family protein [Thermodesulfobacteriota bacterium]
MIRPIIEELIRLFYPVSCLACGSGRQLLCPDCRAGIDLSGMPTCPVCGIPFPHTAGNDHRCAACLRGDHAFDLARSAVLYQGAARQLLRDFKYRRDFSALPLFTRLLRGQLPEWLPAEADIVLPVPLHLKRLRDRGFNQALVLARGLCHARPETIDPFVLVRDRWTVPQTSLHGRERRRNLQNAFQVKHPERVRNKTVLLVDDVMTTGTTANECARVLKKNGAARVLVATLARVP